MAKKNKKNDKKAADGEEEDEDEGGGGGKKKIIMIVGALVMAGAVYNFVLKKPAAPPVEPLTPDQIAATMTPDQIKAALEPPEGEIFPMEEMILNLEGTKPAYLKITLALVLEEGELAEEFALEAPIAQDVAVQYLTAQTLEDFATPEGRLEIKEHLSELTRAAYHDEKVVRVLITALVTQ